MRIYTHTRKAKTYRLKQSTGVLIATMLLVATIFILFFALAGLFWPALANSYWSIGIMGLLSTILGLRVGNAISHTDAPHEVLIAGLKGLPQKTTLYNYWLPVEHLMITDNGIYTITVRSQKGNLLFSGDRPRSQDKVFTRIVQSFTQPTLGHPVREAVYHADMAERWLRKNLPDSQASKVTVQPILAFTNKDVTLTISDNNKPSIPVVYASKRDPSLRGFLKDGGQAQQAQTIDIDELVAQLNAKLKIDDEK